MFETFGMDRRLTGMVSCEQSGLSRPVEQAVPLRGSRVSDTPIDARLTKSNREEVSDHHFIYYDRGLAA
ncbi:MAG: hypothetical protein ABIR47_06700 [Candidatus Kapaibacterium sp.]